MDEKEVLKELLEAHQLLRHDFMNNIQVITGFQQIGQPEKANEYIQKTISFIRRFSRLGEIKAPLLQGLLILYLTKYADLFPAFGVRVDSALLLSEEEEVELAGLLHGIMGVLEQPLKEGELSCQILLGLEHNGLYFMLDGQSVSLGRVQEKVSTVLKNALFNCEMLQKGNTIQVKIYPMIRSGF